jgi:respiratory burst oxidase
MNVPCVNRFQWHPFSIASAPKNNYLILMIKRNGDWTGKLIDKLYDAKKKILKVKDFNISNYDENDVFSFLFEMDDQKEINDMRTSFFPKVHISRAITAPAESAAYRKHFIMIGAGSGIAPFLSFLEDQSDVVENLTSPEKSKKNTFSCYKRAHIVIIIRGDDQISWISNYFAQILAQEPVKNKITFHIYLTKKKKLQNFHSFLFWRAMLLLSVKNYERVEKGLESGNDPFTNCPVRIFFGRPNFEVLFERILE